MIDAKNDDYKRGGILLFDKPKGMLSHDVVKLVRKTLGTKAVGHSGTLDPLASGLMVVLVNQATKLSQYLLNSDKTYLVTVSLGKETDTYDADGKVVGEYKISVDKKDIAAAVDKYTGLINLVVPPYSATKYKGKKLYEYARQGLDVPKIVKPMHFRNVDLVYVGTDYFKARLCVSKGTYIRSWAHEIGKFLKTGGYVKELKRTGSHPYDVSDAITIDDLKNCDIQKGFIPLDGVLHIWPEYYLRGKWQDEIMNGKIPNGLMWEAWNLINDKGAMVVRLKSARDGSLIGLLALSGNNFRVTCIFR